MAYLKSSQITGLSAKDVDVKGFTQADTINLGDRVYTEHEVLLADAYKIVGDVTVSDDLILSKLSDDGDDITITGDTTTRTISGSGSIQGATLAQTPNSTLEGMTGTLGTGVTLDAAVTGSPALNLTNATKMPSGSVVQALTSDPDVKAGVTGWVGNQDFEWGTYAAPLRFIAPAAGNKLMMWGSGSGYLGELDRSAYWTWYVKDNVNNEQNLALLSKNSGGMGMSTTRNWLSAYYMYSGSPYDHGYTGDTRGWYTVPSGISGNVEVRLLIRVTNTGNTWMSWVADAMGLEIQA